MRLFFNIQRNIVTTLYHISYKTSGKYLTLRTHCQGLNKVSSVLVVYVNDMLMGTCADSIESGGTVHRDELP